MATQITEEEKKELYRQYGLRYYTSKEEFWHCVTHILPIFYYIIFFVILLLRVNTIREKWGVILTIGFGLLVYINSSIYHGLRNLKLKSFWRKLDHCGIPFQILGCCAPISLIYEESTFNIIGLIISICVAICVVILMYVNLEKFNYLTLALDFVIGVINIVIFFLNIKVMPKNAMIIFIIGGILAGISGALYPIKKKYMHIVFHLFCAFGPMLCVLATYYMLQN